MPTSKRLESPLTVQTAVDDVANCCCCCFFLNYIQCCSVCFIFSRCKGTSGGRDVLLFALVLHANVKTYAPVLAWQFHPPCKKKNALSTCQCLSCDSTAGHVFIHKTLLILIPLIPWTAAATPPGQSLGKTVCVEGETCSSVVVKWTKITAASKWHSSIFLLFFKDNIFPWPFQTAFSITLTFYILLYLLTADLWQCLLCVQSKGTIMHFSYVFSLLWKGKPDYQSGFYAIYKLCGWNEIKFRRYWLFHLFLLVSCDLKDYFFFCHY